MNLATRKVQGLASAIVKNIWDTSYSPIDGKRNSLMFAIEDTFAIDKAYSNWDYQFLMHCIYALIQDSCMEMKLSTDIDPLGRPSWEVCRPGSFAYDPNWTSGLSKDLEFCFKYMKITAYQIISLYPEKTEQIRHALFTDLQGGGNFDVPLIDALKDYQFSRTLNGLYNVIEYNYLVSEQVTKEFTTSGIELPETDDTAFKQKFLEANGIPLSDVKAITIEEKKAKIITICPDLMPTETLYDGYDIFQIKRLRFFPMSAERVSGEPRGAMDIIAPMQDAINKLANNIQGIIDMSAHGGGAFDPAIVGNDPKAIAEIKENWADPGFKFLTTPGALSKGTANFFQQFPYNKVDGAIFTQLANLLNELNNDMLPINPAAEGKSEHAAEPGIVFNMKMSAIEQAQLVLMKNIENFLMEIGEAYLDSYKIFYSKARRVFYKSDGNEIVINDVKTLENGDVAIDNDVASIQKCRVVVTLSPKSPNARFTQRMTQLDMLNFLMKDPQNNVELIAIHLAKLEETIDYDDDEEKLVIEATKRRLQHAKQVMDNMLNPQPAQTKQKEPSQSISFKDLPPQGQVQLAKKAGIDITPQQTPIPGQPDHPVNKFAQQLSALQPAGAIA
jgi:hypothetical protein